MDLWVEKYRPKALEDYVWSDPALRVKVDDWLQGGALPHLLLTGSPGSGKTSLAKLLFRLLGVKTGDLLEINASRERKIDEVIPKILTFCTTFSIEPGKLKYVLLDEVDQFTAHSQRALRGEMEAYHDSVRFVLTCNYPNKIIPALHSRCQTFHFQALDRDEYMVRIANILTAEGVPVETEEDISILDEYVEETHPDLRRCINMLQQGVVGGKLQPFKKEAKGVGKDYMFEMVNLFKVGRVTEARKLLVEAAPAEEYNDIYRFMYQHLEFWGDTEAQQNEALLIIRKGLVNHTLVGDIEINLAATLVELGNITK